MQIKPFEDYLRHEKRASKHTVAAYLNDLQNFSHYLLVNYQIDKLMEIEHHHIRSWVVSFIEQGYASTSVNRKISSLKAFFRFHLRLGHIDTNPMKKVVSPKIKGRLPLFVDENGMENLFSEIEFSQDYRGRRDRLILELFYNTGIRLSELINLKDNWVDLNENTIKVLGKRNKERIIPISSSFSTILSEYISFKKSENLSNSEGYFFVSDKGEKLYEKFVYRIVNYYLGMVTTINKKSPHVLRHTFATHMLNRGAELNTIKEILGHSSLAATQVYTHNSIEKLKDVHKKAHPKG
jgi:integrase/recombinase XerC